MPSEAIAHKSLKRFLRWRNYVYFLRWRFKVVRVRFNAANSIYRLKRSGSKGLFIDCGSNLGQGFDFFRRFYTPQFFDYVLFEPNPNCFDLLDRKISAFEDHNVQLFQKAIGVTNGRLNFYGLDEKEGGKYSVGGSVLKEHNSNSYHASDEKSIMVETISFSDFVREQSENYKTIIIKMDIEGGEYTVIDDLLDTQLFNSIETFYIEFHSQYMSPESKVAYAEKERRFWKRVKETSCSALLWI